MYLWVLLYDLVVLLQIYNSLTFLLIFLIRLNRQYQAQHEHDEDTPLSTFTEF
jgi:hypothetical protein